MRPFPEIRVVEIAGSPAGSYAGKLFADYGADVVRLGPARNDEDAAFYDLAKTVVEETLDEVEADGRLDAVLPLIQQYMRGAEISAGGFVRGEGKEDLYE